MPFRRLRRRHTVNGPPGTNPLASPSRTGTSTDPGYKDPVAEMQKRKADEEAKARQMMTSDLLSFCIYILQSLLSLIIALINYNTPESAQQEEGLQGEVPEENTEEPANGSKKRYHKVVVATSVVDMFNSFKDDTTKREEEDELMTLIERKHSDTSEKPTEAYLLKATRKSKLPPNDTSENMDLQSMMYLS